MRRRKLLAAAGTLAATVVGGRAASSDGATPGIDVTFVDCTTVEITGAFDSLIIYHAYLFQVESMPSDLQATAIPGVDEPPYEGTVVYQIGEQDAAWVRADGTPVVQRAAVVDWGSVISSIENPGEGQATNPSACLECPAFHPAPPPLTVAAVTPMAAGTLAVTFRYTNPYDDPLRVLAASTFHGATAAAPPATLAPGTHEVTVAWMPRHSDDRLRWTLEPAFADGVWAAAGTRPASAYLDAGHGRRRCGRRWVTSRADREAETDDRP